MSECGLNWLLLVHRLMSKPLIKASFTKCQPESNSPSCLRPPRLRPDAADSSLCATSAQHSPLSVLSVVVFIVYMWTFVITFYYCLGNQIKPFLLLQAEVKTRLEEVVATCLKSNRWQIMLKLVPQCVVQLVTVLFGNDHSLNYCCLDYQAFYSYIAHMQLTVIRVANLPLKISKLFQNKLISDKSSFIIIICWRSSILLFVVEMPTVSAAAT